MFLTVEKLMILRSVSIFAEVSGRSTG